METFKIEYSTKNMKLEVALNVEQFLTLCLLFIITDGKSCGSQGKRCKVCTFLEEKNTFINKEGSDTYKIREGLHLDCNSERVIYLITCKKCRKQHIGSCMTKFCIHFNNYRSFLTGSFVGAILLFKFYFTLILCQMELWYQQLGNYFN